MVKRFLMGAAMAGLLLAFFCTAFPLTAYAGPPNPAVIPIVQPDGTSFKAQIWGDEWSNGMQTLDGYTIILDSQSGYWNYATRSATGTLIPATGPQGKLIVGKDSPGDLPKLIRPDALAENKYSVARTTQQGKRLPVIGTHKVLVLLVQFSNQFSIGTTPYYWSNKLFGPSESVKQFYTTASFGNLNLAPAEESYDTTNDGVVGWLTLPYGHPNTRGSINDANRQLVRDAIIAADPWVDFASFDTNHDGALSYDELHLVVVVAGYESSYGGSESCKPSVWAHRWALYGTVPAPEVDGVSVANAYNDSGYTELGEWHCGTWAGGRPGHPATIGGVAHELGHDIGLPDLYDIGSDRTYTAGIGAWGIMGYGSWNYVIQPGDSPALPEAWSKWYEGWITSTQVKGISNGVSIIPAETSPAALLLRDNPNGVDWVFNEHSGTGEYFLVENRQQTGFDAGLPGNGWLIWHIDESVTSNNTANANEKHRLVSLEQADGLGQLNKTTGGNEGDAGDPYPYGKKNIFNLTSNPNSKLYSGADSQVAVTSITRGSGGITGNFKIGPICTTLPIAASPIGGGTVDANPPPTCNNNTQYVAGTIVTLTAQPNSGYRFTQWTLDGVPAGMTNVLEVTIGELSNKSVVAWFASMGTHVEEKQAGISYDSWLNVADANANGGSYNTSNHTNDTLSASFKGTSISWVTYTGPDQGMAQVTIDGVSKGKADLYSAAPAWQVLKTYGGLRNATHTIVIKVLGTKNVASTGTNVVVDALMVVTTVIQENAVKKLNSWNTTVTALASNGSYRSSAKAGAVAKFSFTGPGVNWVFATCPGCGKVDVYLDGIFRETVDLYARTPHWNLARSYSSLAVGTHTIEVRVKGTKNAASTGTKVIVDAFEYTP